MLEMDKESFPLPTLGPRLCGLARELDQGRGFWLLRGLPVDALGERNAAFAYWGISLHIGVPASQNARGHLLGHVIDEGMDFHKDDGARGYQTNQRLPYHADVSEVVGLLCLQTAKSGGASSVASSTSLYNEVLNRRPDLAHLWFEEWYSDRRNEELPGEAPFWRHRLATWDQDYLAVRYVRPFLEDAVRHEGVPALTDQRKEFLELTTSILHEPGFALDMDFQQGDIQFLSNYTAVHSRREFEDHDDPARKRHLLRMWLTLHEGRGILSSFATVEQPNSAGMGGVSPVPGIAEPAQGTYV